ncbi:MAG: hypothetical protein JWQ12_2119 [Glaciihabitans sp.]|nr:hypothetical protein [Glaciihabitans sp.]
MFGIKSGTKSLRGTVHAPAELVDALRVVQAHSSSLYKRALAYVVDGDDPALLVELASSKDSSLFDYFQHPGDIQGRSNSTNIIAQNELIAKKVPGWSILKSTRARQSLYNRIELLSAAQVVRFGRLLVAIRGANPVVRTSPSGPDWLPCLLIDVMQPDGQSYSLSNVSAPWVTTQRGSWTPIFLQGLLEHEFDDVWDADEKASGVVQTVLCTLFDRAALGNYWYRYPIDSLSRLVGLDDYIVQHRDDLALVLPRFALDGRRSVLSLIKSQPELVLPLRELISSLLQDSSKLVRADAVAAVASLSDDEQLNVLEPLLLIAPTFSIGDIIVATSRVPGGSDVLARALVESAHAGGAAAARRREALQTAIARSTAFVEVADEFERTRYVRPASTPLGENFVRRTMDTIAEVAATQREVIARRGAKDLNTWEKHRIPHAEKLLAELTRFSEKDARALATYLTSGGPQPASLELLGRHDFNGKHKGLTLHQAARLYAARTDGRGGPQNVPWWAITAAANGNGDFDLREMRDAAEDAGFHHALEATAAVCFPRWGSGLEQFSDENVWPFFDEHPELLRQLLGVESGPMRSGEVSADDIAGALQVIGMMPVIPAQLLPRITELALGDGKRHRLAAQRLLEARPGVIDLAVGALADKKLEVRATAAIWLGRMGDASAIKPVRRALAGEKREVVRASLLTALEQLGDDIGKDLAPAKLQSEAAVGLKGKFPAALEWFPTAALPKVKWASNGKPVSTEVLQWWVVLANKLKDPSGAGIVGRYLSLLEPTSREQLGEFILSTWIAQDTRHPSDADCRAVAQAEAPRRYASWQGYAKTYPQLAQEPQVRFTVDAWYDVVRREHAATYLGSAINEKGLLALASGTRGATLVQVIQRFMKDNYLKRAQVEALVTLAASSDDLAATQLVLATARRHRTASVQAKARELVDQLAERRNWTADELADRTIPTAGFEDDGILHLNYGTREFLGRITNTNTLELSDDNGKVIKALPAARVDESTDLVSEAKSQLTASRKELKQQLGMQTSRLYEAMCAERHWSASDFEEYLLRHPLMSRLVSRLVWTVRATDAASSYTLFRPDGTGQLLDVADNDVSLDAGSIVQVAHASLMTKSEVDVWSAHLADYDVVPLFDQLATTRPDVDGAAQDEIRDREGWLADTFTVRGVATKRGYQRGPGEDGGWFSEYLKSFTSVNIEAIITFTGNTLPEENIPAAITTLSFRQLKSRRRGQPVPLTDVPPVLLAESYADYLAIAATGSFDVDWKKKAGW